MTLAEAAKRIEELERKVAALELRQPTVIHYHYQPAQAPLQPYPWTQPWCGGVGLTAS